MPELKLSDIKMLSREETLVLEEVDRGTSTEDIAKLFKIGLDEVNATVQQAKAKRDALVKVVEELGGASGELPSTHIRKVSDQINVVQKGTMKVGSQVLRYLSEGIYSSPAASLKELISNSFDSDSPTVELRITTEQVFISDKGHGMNWKNFDEDFTFISRSPKRERNKRTKIYNRPLIGFLGIGFISVAELCDTMIIKSCKANEDKFFIAEIDFSKFRTLELTDKEFYEVSEYKLTNYLKKDDNISIESSFTEITLKNLQPEFKDIINDRQPFGKEEVNVTKFVEYSCTQKKGITDLGQYWRLLWEIACMAPVKYPKQTAKMNKIISDINNELESYNFTVTVNCNEIVKPFNFPMSGDLDGEYDILPIKQTLETSKGELSFHGYVYTQHGMICPKEYIGLLLRIKNVAIGPIDRNMLDYPSGANQMFRNWVFGEIYIDSGLEDAININRNQFKLTDSNYIALKKWIHQFLDKVVFKKTDQYYEKGSQEKEEERHAQNTEMLKKIVKEELGNDYKFHFEEIPEDQPLKMDKKEKTVTVNSNFPAYRVKADKKPIIQQMLLLFEIAFEKSNGDIETLKKNFREEIKRWVK